MKKKLFGSVPMTFVLVLIVFFLYYQFIMNPGVNEDAPLPDGLHPAVDHNKNLLISKAGDKGIKVIITDGFRSIPEQDSLYEKGRSDEGEIVTHAKGGESYHNFGLAIDFAILNNAGSPIWDTDYDGNGNSQSDWMEVVAIAKELGFEWGGDWEHFKDYPHLEMNFGLSTNELMQGKRPPDGALASSQD